MSQTTRPCGSFTTLKPMLANWEERRGKGAEAVIEVPDALLARGADLVRRIFVEVAQQARVESEAVRKDAEARVTEVRAELSEATEEIARLEAQDLARTAELSSLRDEHKALELQAAGLKERAALAARLESELRDARAALAKSEQQVADLQAQLAKAGDVQKLLKGLEARLAPAGAAAKGKR